MGLIGSRKVTGKLQEFMLTALFLTSCISQGFRARTVQAACLNITFTVGTDRRHRNIKRAEVELVAYNVYHVQHLH